MPVLLAEKDLESWLRGEAGIEVLNSESYRMWFKPALMTQVDIDERRSIGRDRHAHRLSWQRRSDDRR
jgi:hypothetical protein